MKYERLTLIRGFNDGPDFVGLFELFASTNRKSGYVVGHGTQQLRWQHSAIITSGEEVESLDCKHARGMAIGSSLIEFDGDPQLAFPARYIIADEPGLELVTRQKVKIRWTLRGLIEVPQFCVSLIDEETSNVLEPLGFGRVRDGVLAAAIDLKPREWDVYGFVTDDEMLAGALEIVGLFDEHVFETNILGIRERGRELKNGDPLFGRFRSMVKETRISAEGLIAEVVDMGIAGLPELRVSR